MSFLIFLLLMVFRCFVIMTYVDETTNFFSMALTSASHFATTLYELEKIEDDCEFCFKLKLLDHKWHIVLR